MAVEIAHLSYVYPDGTPALKDVSLSVQSGESVAVIGPNGAGKSSLLLHLNALLQGSGEVRILGMAVTKKTLKSIRSRVGLVFQDPNIQLFMHTVYDDIAFGPRNLKGNKQDIPLRVKSVLEKLSIQGFEARSPERISLGEKKRVALATIMILEPDIWVFDEPTAGLDPGTRRRFIGILKNLPKTKIIASHDLDLVRRLCSRVILMSHGRIVEDGAAKRILDDIPLLRKHDLA